jgi:hypothetical protein
LFYLLIFDVSNDQFVDLNYVTDFLRSTGSGTSGLPLISNLIRNTVS